MRARETFEAYSRVPDGATLHVRVGEDTSSFRSNAQIVSTGDDDTSWSHSVLAGPSGKLILDSRNYYLVKVRVEFKDNKKKKATVNTRITYIDKDGNEKEHSTPYTWEFQGKKGDPRVICGVMISTERG